MFFMLHLSKEEMEYLRRGLIQIILRMDMREFLSELGIFKTKLSSDLSVDLSFEDKIVIGVTSLRSAEISWNARPLQQYLRWATKYFEEGFVQGDLEKQLGFQVSPFCDRDGLANTSKAQLGLILVLVQPLMAAYGVLLNSRDYNMDVLDQGLEANRTYLRSWVN